MATSDVKRLDDGRDQNGGAAAWRAADWAGLAIVLGLFGWLLSLFFVPAYFGGIDESSYMVEAKQLAQTGQPLLHREDPAIFVPENMVERSPGEFVAKYPSGYPMLCALGYRLLGPAGAFYVNPLMGVLTLIGTFVLLRGWVSTWFALAGTFTLALHPLMLVYSTGALSHIAETAFCVWGMVMAVRWAKDGGVLWAGIAGLLIGYACSIRYTAALTVLPLAVLVIQRVAAAGSGKSRWIVGRDAGVMALGGVAALIPLLAYQWASFGTPWATGYGLTNESAAFSWKWFVEHAGYALLSLNLPGYGLVVLFPLAFAWLVYAARRDRKRGLFLGAWILPPLLLYTAYYWIPSESKDRVQYVRFFFQLFPPLIVAAMLLAARMTTRRPAYRKGAAAAIGLLALAVFAWSGARAHAEEALATARFSEEAGLLTARKKPPGAALVCDPAMAYFQLFATDGDVIDPDYFDAGWVQKKEQDLSPDRIHVFNPLRARRFEDRLGHRTQDQLNTLFLDLLRSKAASPAGLYLLTTQEQLPWWKARFSGKLEWVEVGTSPYHQILLRVRTPAANPEK